jgi:glutamate 5-kinase
MAPHGAVYIDAGAHKALVRKAGLLPVGVVDVEGPFSQHEAVRLVVVERRTTPGADGKMPEQPGEEVGRALVNYSSNEIKRIKGHMSTEIRNLLGYADSEYVAARDCISLFGKASRPVTPSLDSFDSPAGTGYLTPR